MFKFPDNRLFVQVDSSVNILAFTLLGEFEQVFIILRFHLGQKLDEFGRLPDAIQISIALVARIELKAGNGGLS